VLIGDVSGKGVPAALTMAQVLAEFRLSAGIADSPAEVLGRLNERLVEVSQRGTFCTMSYVVIDLRNGRLVGANAGHHPALLISADGTESLLGASAPPVGVLPGIVWQDVSAELRPGETLLLYTDGIVEARSGGTQVPEGGSPNEYQIEGLERVVRAHAESTLHELIEAVLVDVRQFCSPLSPHDDCTMIAIKYRGNG